MPEWAIVLTVVFSGVAALSSVGGMFWYKLQSAKDAGRLEEKVDSLSTQMASHTVTLGRCQLAENCEKDMGQMADRIGSAHKRMDGLERRIERVEGWAKA